MTEFTYKTFTGKGTEGQPPAYLITERDALIVDMAIKLGRPLLVEGEAGCGKTTLANAVADELGLGTPIIAPVRSSSRANDLFYRFDSLARFQESRTRADGETTAIQNHITLEPVGEAIVKGRKSVILIDEIDKADMDFQNDLLFALERYEFIIDEIPARFDTEINGVKHRMGRSGGDKPIIIFTSNQEKMLPKPFLRRCLYLELHFPETTDQLIQIVHANLHRRVVEQAAGAAALEQLHEDIIARAVTSFMAIRRAATADSAIKAPATAELLDWVHALHVRPDLAGDLSGLKPPLWQLLFRTRQDQTRHDRHGAGDAPR